MTMQPTATMSGLIAMLATAVWITLTAGPPAHAAEPAMATHEGHRGIWLRTEAVAVFAALEPQFRILSMRRPDEVSLMAGDGVAEQGLRLAFMEPDQIPASFDVGNVPAVLLEQSGHAARCELRSADGLQYVVSITLDPTTARVRLTYTLTNVGDIQRRVAPWSVIAFERRGMIVIPFGDQPRSRRRIVLPWWGEWPQPGVQIGRGALISDAAAPLAGAAYKLGVITEAGWVAFVRDNQCLLSQVDFVADQPYPEDGANITVFHAHGNQRTWCETEQMGPLRTLEPGESTSIEETITLLTVDRPVDRTPDGFRAAIDDARQ